MINLLADLQDELDLTYLLIAHDLSVVRHVSDRVAVTYLGKIVEFDDRNAVHSPPLYPYTVAMLSAVPVLDPTRRSRSRRTLLTGDVPSPLTRLRLPVPLGQPSDRVVEPVRCSAASAPPWFSGRPPNL